MITKLLARLSLLLLAGLLVVAPARAQFTDQATGIFTTAGSSNAYTVAIPNVNSLNDALAVKFTISPNFSNTGASTLNISGTGVKNILKPGPAGLVPLLNGDFQTTQPVMVQYDGTQYVALSSLNSTTQSIFPFPQGRITLVTGVPVMTGDVAGATAAYYTPGPNGNQVPIWNGTAYVVFSVAELTLTIPSSRLANLIYDGCIFSNAGVATFVMGPAWSNSAAGAGARGTGAGTPQLTRLNGFLVNAVSISAVNGGSTFTVPANQCTYVGSFFMDGTNGQVSFLMAYGQSRKTGIWNYYNRQPLILKAGDPAGSWTNTSTSYRALNNNAANNITVFSGYDEDQYDLQLMQNGTNSSNNAQINYAIGWNSTTVASGQQSQNGNVVGTINQVSIAAFQQAPKLGINVATALEKTASSTQTSLGGEANSLLTAKWRY